MTLDKKLISSMTGLALLGFSIGCDYNKKELEANVEYKTHSFTNLAEILYKEMEAPARAIAIGDLDGDGDNDIAITTAGAGEIIFYENKIPQKKQH